MNTKPFLTPIAKIIEDLFAKTEYKKKFTESQLAYVWSTVVGEKLNQHTRPEKIQNGVLTCRVDSSPWLYELQFMKKDIVQKINTVMKKRLVRDIYFILGSISHL